MRKILRRILPDPRRPASMVEDDDLLREAAVRVYAEIPAIDPPLVTGDILIDGMWDNPNHWLRLALLRAAIGLPNDSQVGLTGEFRAAESAQVFRAFGIKRQISFRDFLRDTASGVNMARALVEDTRRSDDILKWKLPFDFPADMFYDYLLKKQRRHTVTIDDSNFEHHVAQGIYQIEAADRLLASQRFELVILSHLLNVSYGSIAWLALKRGIPIVILSSKYGSNRFWRAKGTDTIYDRFGSQRVKNLDWIYSPDFKSLEEVGRAAIDLRRSGKVEELSARRAFAGGQRVNLQDIREKFNWRDSKPIVAVYASNWFDFPHMVGMSNFRDFWDWIAETVRVAKETDDVYWLFKAHATESWYKGPKLSELVEFGGARHLGIAPDDWNSAAIQSVVDAGITCHGTGALEFASIGTPVLAADTGWFHEHRFVLYPGSRAAYLEALKRPWWEDISMGEASIRARIFAGWFYGLPHWQSSFEMPHDVQEDRYKAGMQLLNGAPELVMRELTEIRQWFESGESHLHSYKLRKAENYCVPSR